MRKTQEEIQNKKIKNRTHEKVKREKCSAGDKRGGKRSAKIQEEKEKPKTRRVEERKCQGWREIIRERKVFL